LPLIRSTERGKKKNTQTRPYSGPTTRLLGKKKKRGGEQLLYRLRLAGYDDLLSSEHEDVKKKKEKGRKEKDFQPHDSNMLARVSAKRS